MLPEISNKINKSHSSIVQLKGINFSDNYEDGEMVDSKNISARRFPYISTRAPREKLNQYANVTGISAHTELVVIEGHDVYYNGVKVPDFEVTDGDKQIVSINTKILIFPDWKVIDISSGSPVGIAKESINYNVPLTSYSNAYNNKKGTFVKFELTSAYNYKCTVYHLLTTVTDTGIFNSVSQTDTYRYARIAIGTNTSSGVRLTSGLEKEIKYLSEYDNNRFEILTFSFYSTTSFTTGSNITLGSFVMVSKEQPNMDYICVHNNRLYGCSSAAQAIYASALGDPFEWYDFNGLSTDSYAVNVASPGGFEGCCSYSSSVLFWKQDRLHKLVGDYPEEYYLYTYDVEGLKHGAYKSMITINEVLYYMGINGVYQYSGATPQLISKNFGNKDFTDAIAGTDGDSYYLSVMEGSTPYLLVYETHYGLWLLEDHIRCDDFARIGKDLYFLSGGYVYKMGSGSEDDIEWNFRFAPMYETIDGKKTYSRIAIRAELPKGSYMRVSARVDDGIWNETAKIVGKSNHINEIMLPINRCDKFELKISGKGKMAILSILREYAVRSAR